METRLLKNIFESIASATRLTALQGIAAQFASLAEEIKKKNEKYPKLSLTFNDGSEALRDQFNFEEGSFSNHSPSSLEKLLYALSWKQGDIRKLKHIVDGLSDQSDQPPNNGITFWYFGRHLRNPVENPIIDRNVILAFAVYVDDNKVEKIKNTQALSVKEKDIILRYITWYRNLSESVRQSKESRELVDDILFCAGRMFRNSKKGMKLE